jgi:hypothetical protein
MLLYILLEVTVLALWAVTLVVMAVAFFTFSPTIQWGLFHVLLTLSALLSLLFIAVGAMLARATSSLHPKALMALERRTSQLQRLGLCYLWFGGWLGLYFAVSVVLFPVQPPTRWTIEMVVLVAALPIVGLIAAWPLRAHRASERRRRARLT